MVTKSTAKKSDIFRLTLVLLIFIFFYILIITRLFYWQVVRSEDLKKEERLQSTESLTVPAQRGNILSADNFPLATNKFSYLVYANPKVIDDKNEYVQKLAPILQEDEASVAAQLSK